MTGSAFALKKHKYLGYYKMIRLNVNINNNFWMRLRTESTIIMSSLRRGNPNSSSSQKKNTADKSDDDIDPEQFARILELLTNPKLKNILKPEIADALEDNLSVLQKTDSFEAQRCVLIQRFCLLNDY